MCTPPRQRRAPVTGAACLILAAAILCPRPAEAQAAALRDPARFAGVSFVADDQRPQPLSPAAGPAVSERPVAWKAALGDSLRLVLLEHAIRIAFQEKTRRELGGPFFRDYIDSVHIPTDWEDGDSWFVNYVGHPIHGAAAGYLWRDASTTPGSVTFGLSKAYWASMGRSGAWIAGYSLQFEFGPLSEASIGNVGITEDTRGWVDHVVTPIVGMGLMAAEDALDRYLVLFAERHIGNRVFRAILRLAFNPARILSNTAQGHLPWYRPDRPLSGRR
ncbi:MAG: hypothetical protein R2752_19570 [Vicinamibacterales bacterium]